MNFKIYKNQSVVRQGTIPGGDHEKYVKAFIEINNFHSATYKEYSTSPPGYLIQTEPGELTTSNTMVFLLEA